MQWQVYARREDGKAAVVLGADDGSGDIMDVIAARLPPGEWDVTAEVIPPRSERGRPQ